MVAVKGPYEFRFMHLLVIKRIFGQVDLVNWINWLDSQDFVNKCAIVGDFSGLWTQLCGDLIGTSIIIY